MQNVAKLYNRKVRTEAAWPPHEILISYNVSSYCLDEIKSRKWKIKAFSDFFNRNLNFILKDLKIHRKDKKKSAKQKCKLNKGKKKFLIEN